MKKLLAILLALVVVGGAFAQVTTAISASGAVQFVDQGGWASFNKDGLGYNTLTFKGSDADGKWGFSVTDEDFITSAFEIRDWSAWYKGDFTKVIVGQIRNADIRLLGATGGNAANFAGTQRFFGVAGTGAGKYGMIVESTTLGALTLGLGLPILETKAQIADVACKTEIGAAYTIENVGKFIVLVRPDLVTTTNVVTNVGFTYTGMEGLTATVIGRYDIKAADDFRFNVGADYGKDKITGGFEFSAVSAAEFDWDVYAYGGYQVLDPLAATLEATYASDESYSVNLNVEWDHGNGMTCGADIGYNGELTNDLYVGYSISL